MTALVWKSDDPQAAESGFSGLYRCEFFVAANLQVKIWMIIHLYGDDEGK
jgi:hypothetical protein